MGVVMWEEGELAPGRVDHEIAAGLFFIADVDKDPAGVLRFQLEDRLFWPGSTTDDSAFIHRLVVRRRYKGLGVSTALMEWAVSCPDDRKALPTAGHRCVHGRSCEG